MTTTPYRILFVCMGNICRSPAAEGVLRHMVRAEGLEDRILLDSAGTLGFHSGSPPDARMTRAAARRGIRLEGAARQFTRSDFEAFDLILTMDEDNYTNVRRLDPQDQFLSKVKRFCDFCQEFDDREVPDPYYGGEAGFEHVMDLLEDGCRQIKQHALEESDRRTG